MKRAPLLVAGLIVAATSTAAVASSAGGAARANDSRAAKIQLRHTGVGKVLVDGSGFTLYRFSKDPRNSDTCVKISGCTNLWPPVKASGKPVAGPGVSMNLAERVVDAVVALAHAAPDPAPAPAAEPAPTGP